MKPDSVSRRDFLAASAAALPAPQGRAARPNIVIIMADQHRAGFTRRSGFALDTMPALDRLAGRGVAFDRAYTTAPLCVPARVSMLTGRWPHAHRVRENSGGAHIVFEQDLFDIARARGYKTALTGKNHSHLTPKKADFWRPYGHLGGWKPDPPPQQTAEFDKWLEHLNHGCAQEATPFPPETQLPYRIVSNALEFVRAAANDPFLLWVSFPEPHNPYQVPKPYFDMFPPEAVPPRAVGPEGLRGKNFKWQWLRELEERTYPGYDQQWRRTKSNYLGMLRLIDDQVARLLSGLDLANTIVVYLSDHGDYVTDYSLIRKGAGLPEVLTRVPMVWAGAGVRAQAPPDAFVSLADVLPTVCDAIGAEAPKGMQGRSLWPLLQGKSYAKEEFRSIYTEVGFGGLHYTAADAPDFSIAQPKGAPGAILTFDELNPVTQSGYTKSVRMGDWKLIFDMMGAGELYNLAADPYELKNLYGDPRAAEAQSKMLAELLHWTIRTQDTLPTARYKTKWK
ncbi:MAG: sulfatase [Bryobacteraceae bacterium]